MLYPASPGRPDSGSLVLYDTGRLAKGDDPSDGQADYSGTAVDVSARFAETGGGLTYSYRIGREHSAS